MTLTLSVILLVALPGGTMASGVAATGSGTVVAAPHEGFDEHTAPIAKAIAASLGWGWVVAEDYRKPKKRWLDVNRPTQRLYRSGKLQPAEETKRAREVYTAYQSLLRTAGRREGQLDLLVEIHGHARAIKRKGQRPLKVQAIELATRGFGKPALRKLKLHYLRLQAALDPADRIPLAVEQLDPTYRFAGRRVKFRFHASGSKRSGSLSPASTRRALHFELPSKVRFDARRRELYATLLTELLRNGH